MTAAGLGAWGGRFNARWRKWWRDPAAFADELPSAVLRRLMLFGMGGGTVVSGALDPRDAAAARAWRRQGVVLAKAHHSFEDFQFVGRDGRSPSLWPRRLLVEAPDAAVVVVAFMQDGEMMTAAEASPGRPGLIVLDGHAAWCRVYRTDDGEITPEQLSARPASRAELVRLWMAQGVPYAETLRRVWPPVERRAATPPGRTYQAWIERNEPGPADAAAIAAWLDRNPDLPTISVVMPVHDPKPAHLSAAIASVRAQRYRNWRLCIADDGSRSTEVRRILAEAAGEERIRLVRLEQSRGVAAATNAALELAEGEAVLFMDHDDLLAPHALALFGAAFAEDPGLVALYSDEDTIDVAGRRSAPLFKPELDRERLLAQNYVNHAFAARLGLVRRLGGLAEGIDGVQDHELALRIAAAGEGRIARLPHVLYHWRVYPGGGTFSQSRSGEIDRVRARMVRDKQGASASIRLGRGGHLIVERALADPPPEVTAIIPTRDRPGLLEACAAGLLEQTDYPALKLVIVDNGSVTERAKRALDKLAEHPRVSVLRIDAPFNFAALNNAAARASASPLLALVNDDVMVVEPGWLKAMAALALEPDVGAVGAKLFYPDGRIQHAGIVLGLGPQRAAGHEFRGAPGDSPGPQNRLLVTREASAVTAACMVIDRRKFEAVGGFDEAAFPVAFNDVDLCLRLRRQGWRTIWTPQARLMHLESATRGPDKAADPRFADEVRRLRERWEAELAADPSYNPNLTLEDESFTLAPRTRARLPWRP